MDKKKLTKEEKEEIKRKKEEEKNKKEKFDEEIDSYRKTSFFEKIPFIVKALLLKWWIYGVICFFVLMGLGQLGVRDYIAVIVCGLLGGIVLDLVYGNLCLLMDDDEENINWVMIYKSKKVYSLILNIVFALIVFFITSWICNAFVILWKNWLNDDSFFLFQEPCTQAIILLIIDQIIISIKQGILKLIDYIKLKKIKKKLEKK